MLKLVSVFSDGAVLQQCAETVIRGFSEPGKTVSLSLKKNGKTVFSGKTVSLPDGTFSVALRGEKASYEKYTLSVKCAADSVSVGNILFGDVWIAAGQSNMEMRHKYCEPDPDLTNEAIQNGMRFYRYNRSLLSSAPEAPYPAMPLPDSDGKWMIASDRESFDFASAAAASAVTFVTRELKKSGEDIPVAFLNLNFGGSPIEAWLPRDGGECDRELISLMKQMNRYTSPENWNKNTVRANYRQFGALFNAIIAPVIGMKAKGILWYQGESNIDEKPLSAEYYEHALKFLISEYKKLFSPSENGKFPFICSLLYTYPYGRSANVRKGYINSAIIKVCTADSENLSFFPIHDLSPAWSYACNYHPLHPTHKKALGERFGGIMLSLAYGKKGIRSAACFSSAKFADGGVYVTFNTHGYRLSCPENAEPKGFYLRSENSVFVPAKGKIVSKNTVFVKNGYTDPPTDVLYCFADLDDAGNLFCGKISVAPFSTVKSEKPYSVAIKPWLDASVLSAFHSPDFSEENMFEYPVRYPLFGCFLSWDRAYRATRMLAADSGKKVGISVRNAYSMPLDLENYSMIRFEVFAESTIVPSIAVNFKDSDSPTVIPVTVSSVPASGKLDCSAPLSVPEGSAAETLDFIFDISETGFPTAALGNIELIPKK